jgi:hypothetical protein
MRIRIRNLLDLGSGMKNSDPDKHSGFATLVRANGMEMPRINYMYRT